MEVPGKQMTTDFFAEAKKEILKKWTDRIFASYPAGSISFLRDNTNQFNNPVGHTILKETVLIYDQLTGEMNFDELAESLNRIIKIRAVQEFSPSQAVAFTFILKDVIREHCEKDLGDDQFRQNVLRLFSRIDEMAQMAFDIHADCRERLFKIRIDEARMSAFMRRERIIRKDKLTDDKDKPDKNRS